MTSPTRKLAETLDTWAVDKRALITETASDIIVATLSEEDARALVSDLEALGWQHRIEDGTQSIVSKDDIDVDFAPYRVKAEKPPVAQGHESVLTNVGLLDWLSRPPARPILEVCRLDAAFETFAVRFTPWGDTAVFAPETLSAAPRTVVKETGSSRSVPHDLSPWILRDEQTVDLTNSSMASWADVSARNIAMSLCNEFENPNLLVFKGPPASRYKMADEMSVAIGGDAFNAMQDCARWVFSLPKEMETRHILMTAELSRSTPGSDQAIALFKTAASAAIEGAKIAYELGLHKISADSLKALSDLRKAISDEAAKLGDSTRQLAAAVSSALFGGIALIVARLTLATSSAAVSGAVLLIGIVLFLYVVATILSGRQFVALQRDLREQWRNRLYRFLPETEYKKMVTDPAQKAESAFHLASRISMFLAAVLLAAVLAVSIPELLASYQAWRTKPPTTPTSVGLQSAPATPPAAGVTPPNGVAPPSPSNSSP